MATKSIAWNTGSGNITLTYQGQGDGPITIQSDANNLGNSRSQVITIQTVNGAKTKNLTVSQAACPVPVGSINNFSYTGSEQQITLPPGTYKLQCWGAQGGSNAAASSYGITAKAGGKGGYSEGVLTLTSVTILKVYVGGQGSSSAGGFNGGGSTSGSASYSSGGTQGVSRMGGGGGATDIRLSDATLLSRMIVAGGGAGGSMCYKYVSASSTTVTDGYNKGISRTSASGYTKVILEDVPISLGVTYNISCNDYPGGYFLRVYHDYGGLMTDTSGVTVGIDTATYTVTDSNYRYMAAYIEYNGPDSAYANRWVRITHTETTPASSSTNSQVGYAGGGTTGKGYSSTYQGKQNAAGTGGSFGQGANQTITNYRFCSGAGGGGWYGGGGGRYSDSDMSYCKQSGGGSGFVNTSANASYRPTGYIGLELDSGTTKDGATSFEAPGGGTETGHSDNGYARITRLS